MIPDLFFKVRIFFFFFICHLSPEPHPTPATPSFLAKKIRQKKNLANDADGARGPGVCLETYGVASLISLAWGWKRVGSATAGSRRTESAVIST